MSWLPYYRPKPRARMRLFCLPYAGGGASLYNRWADGLPDGIDVCAVQLPGRENRLGEKPLTEGPELLDALVAGLAPYLDRPFAFFGHSMGAKLGFEVARRLAAESRLRAAHLFVSASRAPHIPRDAPPIHHLPEGDFAEELRRLNGIPAAVLADAELRALFLPVLRADFRVVETYRFEDGDALSCPISAFGGEDDEQVRPVHLEAWERHTTRGATLEMIPGGHFYLQPQRERLIASVARVLAPLVSGVP